MINVKVKKLTDTAKLPTYGSKEAACCDLYADIPSGETISIRPHETIKISTGLAMEPPKGCCILIYARSGIATKHGLRPANCVPVIDNDYRGCFFIPIHNDSEATQYIDNGMRIAQMMVVPYAQANFEEVDSLSNTERGSGGFGSTGTK